MQKELYKIAAAKNFRLEYYVLENAIEHEGRLLCVYGIEIIKKQRKDGVFLSEAKSIKNICVSEGQIKSLAQMLAENLVTPITLKDIVEDLIAEHKLATPEEQEILDSVFISA